MTFRKLLLLLLLLINIKIFAQAPVISSFSPANGPLATVVTISGNGYNTVAGNNVVFFGGVKASVISATATSLKVSVPAGSQNLPITVINLGTGLQVNSARPFYTTFVENGTNVFKKESFTSASIHDDNGGFRVWLTLADVDNDGKTDLIVVNSFNQTINIYRNKGISGSLNASSLILAATFNLTPEYLANNPQAVKLADLDGDGKLDIIVPYIDQGKVGVYKNNTTPGVISRAMFGAEIQLNVGSAPTWVSIADLDNDGKPEIIAANHTAGTISVLKNIGTKGNLSAGSFAGKQDVAVGQLGSEPNSVETGDLDGDGKADVVVGNIYGFYVLRNTSTVGIFSFAGTQTTISGSSACNAYLSDMDGDGKYDVVLNGYEQRNVYVFRNTTAAAGSIKFAAAVVLTTASPVDYLQFGDLNGDTRPEIITTPYGGNCTTFRNTNQSGNITAAAFGPEIDLGFGSPDWASTAVGDVDGDGKPDVITEDGYSTITLLHNNIVGLPQITGFTPTSAGPGETVTITGKNFNGAYAVAFGGKPATKIISQSATSISAVLDRGSTGYVAVTNNEGRDSIPGFTYSGPPPPVITSFTPMSGGVGTIIYITGTNFISSPPTIKIGGVYPRNIQSESATTIVAVVDTGATGAITVSNIDGTGSLNGFTFTPKPEIISIDKATAAKGQSVTIKGRYLAGTSSITLGGIPVASFTVVSPTTVKFVVSDGETGDLLLKTNYGQATAGFIFDAPPLTLNAVAPMVAPAGATLQITGTNFSVVPQNNFVFFGTVRGVVTKATPTMLNVTVPYGALYAPISVTTRGYTRSTSKPFVLTFAGGGTINAGTFGARADMFAGNAVNVFSVADFNNDGLPDIILTNWGESNIGTRKNQSERGKFKFEYGYARLSYYGNDEGRPIDGVAIDLNNDGFIDYEAKTDYGYLAQVNNAGGLYFYTEFAGNGYGNGNTTNLVVGDMNGSGHPVVMLSGPVGGKAYVADIDGDNKPDFIVGTANSVAIFRNTTPAGARDATYAPVVNLPVSALAKKLAIGDFDGDGKPDIVALSAAPYTTTGNLIVYRNTGTTGTIAFSQDLIIPVEQDVYNGSSCTVGDVDGDGKIELVYSGNGKTSVFKNIATAGKIAFAPKVDYLADGSVYLNIADFDGDGQPDIAGLGANGEGSQVFILRNLTGTIPITDIKPAYGPAGTKITISGSGFGGAKSVSLGGYNLKNYTVVSSNTITAVVDSTVSGYVSITTAGNTGTSLTKYFTADAPVITPADTVAIFAGDSVKLSATNNPGFYTDVSFNDTRSGYFLAQYQWSKDGADILHATDAFYTVHEPGVYLMYVPLISSGRIASKPVVVKVIEKLPANNFLVSATNASCKGSSTGAINIKAMYTVNYTAVVSGSGYNYTSPFTEQLAINNLPAGKYNVCITVDKYPAMQQCFTLVITEPKDLSLYSVVSSDSKNIRLAMSGGNTYNIQLNGVLHTTTDSTITLPLASGRNNLVVTTDKLCQGVIDKTITAVDQVLPYPNPVDNTLYISLGDQSVLKANVEIYSAMGRIVYKRLFNNPGNTLQLDVSSIGTTGTYVLKLMTDNSPQQVFSIIKR